MSSACTPSARISKHEISQSSRRSTPQRRACATSAASSDDRVTTAACSPPSGMGSTTCRPLGETRTVSRTGAASAASKSSRRRPSCSRRRRAFAVRPSPHVLSRGNVALSTHSTRSPRRWAVIAAAAPAGPAPTTSTSTCVLIACDRTGPRRRQRTSARANTCPASPTITTTQTAVTKSAPASCTNSAARHGTASRTDQQHEQGPQWFETRDESEGLGLGIDEEQQRILQEEHDDPGRGLPRDQCHAVGKDSADRRDRAAAENRGRPVQPPCSVDVPHDAVEFRACEHRGRKQNEHGERQDADAGGDGRCLGHVHAPPRRDEQQLGGQRAGVEVRADERRAEHERHEQHCDTGPLECAFELRPDVQTRVAGHERPAESASRHSGRLTVQRRCRDRHEHDRRAQDERAAHHPARGKPSKIGVELVHRDFPVSSRNTSSSDRVIAVSSAT